MSTEIKSAAGALAQARAGGAKAAEALSRANAGQGRVQARVDALVAERASIVAAARDGAGDPALRQKHGTRAARPGGWRRAPLAEPAALEGRPGRGRRGPLSGGVSPAPTNFPPPATGIRR